MEDNNIDIELKEADEKPINGKKIVSPGVPYPIEPLSASIETINKLVHENGTGVVITKEDISRVTSKKQATLVLWFSTYQQYGLLEKVHGKGFLPTTLYNKYRDKVYDHHERECLLEMFKNPPLYSKIIENLNETNLPSEERFPSLLKNEPYNVNINSTDRASRVFFENLRFLKIIDSNNKLVFKQNTGAAVNEIKKEAPKSETPPSHTETEDNLFTLPIPLDTKRKAFIKYPLNDLKKKDIKVIVKALSFIASSIIDDEMEDFEIKITETKKE